MIPMVMHSSIAAEEQMPQSVYTSKLLPRLATGVLVLNLLIIFWQIFVTDIINMFQKSTELDSQSLDTLDIGS